MSSQIQITGETKVKSLTGVLVGTSGVVSSLNIDGSLGIPQLDVNGKILVSQLPNSVMEYKGTWDASTNTPTLVNGTGNQGDVYLCSVAGTVNFGAGPIAFVVGDQVIYSGTIWQRASGATGTVTSVAITESGDSLNITGSPITTSGTINIGFNGTNLQYVNGAGNLTTFPTLISSIGLSMPSAFSVSNSPLTANGTIAVTGAGYPSQYIRGDGTLADFPTSGGGGSSVSYYLNGGTSQGTIGGVTYYEMSKTADTGTGVDFNKTGDGFIVAFLTDAGDPAQLNIPAGNWNYEIYASMSANGGTPEMYAELYKYDGTTFTLIATSSNEILYDGTNLNLYTFAMTVPSTTLAITDRLAIKLYATNSGGKTTTVHTQDSHLCQIITTFSTGITALNGLTAQVQYFATGTSGTDFNISSATATHTFNIPDASATNRGLITTGTQTIAGAKTFSGLTSFTFSSGTRMDYGPYLTKGSVPSAFSGSTTNIYSDATTNNIVIRDTSSIAKLVFDNSTQTYTFPAASGTIALTSDLSAYVTLATTQTISGVKTFGSSVSINTGGQASLSILSSSGNSALILGYVNSVLKGTIDISATEFKLISAIDNILKFQSSTNFRASLIFSSTADYSYTYPNATGTLALLSGTQTFTGATTFSSDLLVSGLTIGRGGSAVVGNTAIGAGTLAANTTGVFNTALGSSALASNTIGVSNTAIGSNSLLVNTTGNNNTAIGTDSLNVNTTGSRNTAIGYYALNANTTANNNAAIGYYTLVNNTTGAENLGVGNEALRFNTLGNNNVAIGNESLRLNTTGTSNTSIGVGALYSNTTGGNNIAIGYNSATSITTGSNNTIIGGYVGTAAMANNIVLADGAGTIRYQWNGTNNVFSNPISGTSATFSVNQNSTITNSFINTNTTNNSSRTILNVTAGNATLQIQAIHSDNIYITPSTATDTYLGYNNILRLLANGNATFSGSVAIGSSSAPSYTLDVSGTVRGTTSAYFATTSGSVGIAATDPVKTLDVRGTLAISNSSSSYWYMDRDDSDGRFKILTDGNSEKFSIATTGAATFSSSVTATSAFFNASNGFGLAVRNAANTQFRNVIILNSSNQIEIGRDTDISQIRLGTASANDALTITSGGQVNINSSQTTYPFYVQAAINTWTAVMENTTSGSNGLLIRQTGGSAGIYFGAYDGGAYKFFVNGSGVVNSTSTSITIISSDEKLKTDIRDYNKGLAEVLAMKPRIYKRKDNLEIDEVGFIAQEMDIALAGSMIESYKDEEGEPIHTYQLEWYPLLVKAIQEQQAIITSLQDRLDKLENK